MKPEAKLKTFGSPTLTGKDVFFILEFYWNTAASKYSTKRKRKWSVFLFWRTIFESGVRTACDQGRSVLGSNPSIRLLTQNVFITSLKSFFEKKMLNIKRRLLLQTIKPGSATLDLATTTDDRRLSKLLSKSNILNISPPSGREGASSPPSPCPAAGGPAHRPPHRTHRTDLASNQSRVAEVYWRGFFTFFCSKSPDLSTRLCLILCQ